MIDDRNRRAIENEKIEEAISRIPPMIALSAKIFNERITVKFSRNRCELDKNSYYISDIATKNDYREVANSESSNSDIENKPLDCDQTEDETSSSCESEEMPPSGESPNFSSFASHSPSANFESESEDVSKTWFECEFCTKTFTKRRKFSKHKKRHAARRKYNCKICDKVLTSRPAWTYHVKSFHERSRDFVCCYCDKGFVTKQQLLSHIKAHKYICHFCSKPFTARYKLKEHKEVHRIFNCNICNKGFFRNHRLQRHKDLSHSHITEDALMEDQHQIQEEEDCSPEAEIEETGPPISTDEQCKYCGKIFASNDDLQHHWNVTGENFFICAHCLELCEGQAAFSLHLRQHRKEEIFICTLCWKTFVTMDLLEDHCATHAEL